jgi:hypothetical protein
MKVLEQVKTARIALIGNGTLIIDLSIIQYCSLPYQVLESLIKQRDGIGEIMGYAINNGGF